MEAAVTGVAKANQELAKRREEAHPINLRTISIIPEFEIISEFECGAGDGAPLTAD